MQKRKIKRAKTPGKYIIRRTLLAVLAMALVFSGGVVAAYTLLRNESVPVAAAAGVENVENVENVGQDAVTPVETPLTSRTETAQAVSAKKAEDDWRLLLVNAGNPLKENYEDSVTLEIVYRGDRDYKVDSRISSPLLKMMNEAKTNGVDLLICSAYRSKDYQQTLYNGRLQEQLKAGKTQEQARKAVLQYTAYPGTSEHQTGLAVDIVTPSYTALNEGFVKTFAFRWLNENAHLYGFVLRYPKDKVDVTGIAYEPWHYRYVGVEHAKVMKEKGYCLEEYVAELKTPGVNVQQLETEEESLAVREAVTAQGSQPAQSAAPASSSAVQERASQVMEPQSSPSSSSRAGSGSKAESSQSSSSSGSKVESSQSSSRSSVFPQASQSESSESQTQFIPKY